MSKVLTVVLVAALAVALTASIYFGYSLSNSNQQSTLSFAALNQSFSDPNSSYCTLSQQYQISLSDLLGIMQDSGSSTVQPPISEVMALQLALEDGGWNATTLEGMRISISLDYAAIYYEGNSLPGIEILHGVTAPVSNYSASVFVYYNLTNYTGPSLVYPVAFPVTVEYHYIWVITIENAGNFQSIPPPGLYYIDAATGERVGPTLFF